MEKCEESMSQATAVSSRDSSHWSGTFRSLAARTRAHPDRPSDPSDNDRGRGRSRYDTRSRSLNPRSDDDPSPLPRSRVSHTSLDARLLSDRAVRHVDDSLGGWLLSDLLRGLVRYDRCDPYGPWSGPRPCNSIHLSETCLGLRNSARGLLRAATGASLLSGKYSVKGGLLYYPWRSLLGGGKPEGLSLEPTAFLLKVDPSQTWKKGPDVAEGPGHPRQDLSWRCRRGRSLLQDTRPSGPGGPRGTDRDHWRSLGVG